MEFQAIEKLRGADNWNLWKFVIRNLLRGTENTYEVCIGEITKPEALEAGATSEKVAAHNVNLKIWDKADRLASQIIVKSIESKVLLLLVTCETARDMWVKLHAIYEQQTEQAAHTVQAEFFNFSMDPTDDLISHIAKFEGLVLQLQQLKVKPDESSLMVKLLDTLPDDYESLRQAWWARSDNQRTLANLVSILTSDDRRRQQRVVKREELVALVASRDKNDEKRKQKAPRKSTEKSFEKKPPFRCFNCGTVGHMSRNCHKQRRDKNSGGLSKDQTTGFISEVLNTELDNEVWIVDSGATDHLTFHREWYSSYEKFTSPVKIHIGDKSFMTAEGRGTIFFEAEVNGEWLSCHMKNVLYAPGARRNLFSVTSALDNGLSFNSSKSYCEFSKDGVVKARGIRYGQLFRMAIRVKISAVTRDNEANVAVRESLQVWHERMGHQNKRHVLKILQQNGIEVSEKNKFCGACVEGKQHRVSFYSRQQRAKDCAEVMHADLCGPMEAVSLGGAKYFVCFTCDYSRMRFVYFLKEKSETAEKIRDLLQIIKTNFDLSVKSLQCDGGLEFDNAIVKKLLNSNGTRLVITNPYTPEQNGCAERTNRTVVDLARTMLLAKNLPKVLWAEAVNTAVFVLNQTGPSSVDNKTPFKLFTGRTGRLEKLHIFGTECFVHVPKQQRKKWDSKGQKGIFIGYQDNIDGFRIWMQPGNRVIRSKNVVFAPETTEETQALVSSDVDNKLIEDFQLARVEPEANDFDEFCPLVQDDVTPQKSTTDDSGSKRYLRNRASLRPPDRLIESMISEVSEPKSFQEAMTSAERQHWKIAMKKEMQSLEKNSTWSLVKLPVGRKAISNGWVYRIKRDSNGDITRYKARLVVRGYSQREGVDYTETFAPVARFDTIRTVLSIAAVEKLELQQFDVESAFLNGVLEEEIYMYQPQGFSDGSDRVCRLIKSLYGLKQSPRTWNRTFSDVLINYGMSESAADPCLFYRQMDKANRKLIVVLYVDDGLVAATKQKDIDEFLRMLQSNFKITVAPVGHFLNIRISRQKDGSVVIDQKLYAESVLQRFGMVNANKVFIPITTYIDKEDAGAESTTAPYREAVGCLMYLAVATRPDLTFAINYVSQFLENPREKHWIMVKRVMRYLKGTTYLGIKYSASENHGELEAYSDADFANEPKTRRSVSGLLFKYAGGAITWASRKQQSVSLSTTEAEYVAASEAAKEAAWLERLFEEIAPLKKVPLLLVDSASAVKLAKNPEFHRRSKHIDVRHHYVRERVQQRHLIIDHVAGKHQIADILTKPIPRERFENLRDLIGIVRTETN